MKASKEQIIITANQRRIKELRLERNALLMETRDKKRAIDAEIQKLYEENQDIDRMLEDAHQ